MIKTQFHEGRLYGDAKIEWDFLDLGNEPFYWGA